MLRGLRRVGATRHIIPPKLVTLILFLLILETRPWTRPCLDSNWTSCPIENSLLARRDSLSCIDWAVSQTSLRSSEVLVWLKSSLQSSLMFIVLVLVSVSFRGKEVVSRTTQVATLANNTTIIMVIYAKVYSNVVGVYVQQG